MPNLLPGETIVMSRHPHWLVPVKTLLWPVAILVAVAVLDRMLPASLVARDVKVVATLAALALLGGWAIVTWFRWMATTFTITNQRVILEEGLLSRSSKVIPIDRVQDVSMRQSLVARIFRYGSVEIDAAGSQGREVLDHVPSPEAFRDQVFVESERMRRESAGGPAPASAPASAQP